MKDKITDWAYAAENYVKDNPIAWVGVCIAVVVIVGGLTLLASS